MGTAEVHTLRRSWCEGGEVEAEDAMDHAS